MSHLPLSASIGIVSSSISVSKLLLLRGREATLSPTILLGTHVVPDLVQQDEQDVTLELFRVGPAVIVDASLMDLSSGVTYCRCG